MSKETADLIIEAIDEIVDYLDRKDATDSKKWHALCDAEEKSDMPHGTLSERVWGRMEAYRRIKAKCGTVKTMVRKKAKGGAE